MASKQVKDASRVPAYQPDYKTIRAFLLNVLDRDWFHLLSSNPNGDRRRMNGFVTDDIDAAVEWIGKQQAKGWNVYYALNTPSNRQEKKAKKNELKQLWAFHVDLDLPKGTDRQSPGAEAMIDEMRERVCDSRQVPGNPNVIMSGNGVQAVWLMDAPMKATEENQSLVETINKQLAQHFDAPLGTHNSERVLRLPGTWNFPDKLKAARGCVPILSKLLDVASQPFEPADFKKLPKIAPVAIRAPASRRDYTLDNYEDWTPWHWEDFRQHQPDVDYRLSEHLERMDDRSASALFLVFMVLDFLTIVDGRPVEEMLDDNDVKKQIAELCWEGAELSHTVADVMGHFEDHEFKRAQLGHTIGKAMNMAADEGKEATHKAVQGIHARAKHFETNTKPEETVTALEAAHAFIRWIEATTQKSELPNKVESKDAPAPRQPSTMSNVREVLHNGHVMARWDAMRDEPRFFVETTSSTTGGTAQRPALNWSKALQHASAESRSAAELELLCDAMTALGMQDRRMIESFLTELAKEHKYHPLAGYATSVKWDGHDRIGELRDVLKTSHPLARRYLEVFFYQCIAAVLSLDNYQRKRLGLQLSSTVVIVGPQGIGKSTFWEKITPPGMLAEGRSLQLGGSRETDSMSMCLSGLVCSLNEIGQSLRRSDAEALKDFQSATIDKFRIAYGRRPITKPRMTVFVGTANQDFLLQDQTGSRRYLVLPVEWIDWVLLESLTQPAELQQIYAQAWAAVMEKGASWTLTGAEDRIREQENEEHQAEPEELQALDAWENRHGEDCEHAWVTAYQICKLLGLPPSPFRAGQLRRALLERGYDYRVKVKSLRKVYAFPVLRERLDELNLLGR